MTKKTVQKDIRSAVQALTRGDRNIDDGQAAIARDEAELNTGSPTRRVLIENPAESGVDVYLTRQLKTDRVLTGTVSQNVTIDTAGTELTTFNTDIQTPQLDGISVHVEQGGTYSNPAPNTLPIRTAGARGGNTSSPVTAGATFLLRPGANLLYELDSQADGNDYSLEFGFVEIPI